MSKILNTYNRKKISFFKGKGSFLYSTNGKKYLDFVQGIAVNCLGHANEYLIKSVNKQSKKLWHVSNVFTIPEQERLAKRLAQKTFADYVTFQNSGAEATEAAIKFARRYFYSKGQPRKNRVLCINNSFHGRTIAAIFASNSKKAIEGFKPKVDGFDHFNFGDHKGLEKAITSRTAAIMVETIMGEGGIKVIPDFCLKGLRKLCNKKKILLILDEVQCGIGRSGKFFAFEYAKIKPDIVPIAKGIGGGFPIATSSARGSRFGRMWLAESRRSSWFPRTKATTPGRRATNSASRTRARRRRPLSKSSATAPRCSKWEQRGFQATRAAARTALRWKAGASRSANAQRSSTRPRCCACVRGCEAAKPRRFRQSTTRRAIHSTTKARAIRSSTSSPPTRAAAGDCFRAPRRFPR